MVLGILLERPPREEVCSPVFWRDTCAEVVCSMTLVFAAFSVGFRVSEDEPAVDVLTIAVANAGIVFAMIEMLAHVSMAIFNPIVTLLFLFTRKLSPIKAFVYIIAQCFGAIVGASIAYGVANPVARQYMQPPGLNNISVGAGLGCEAFITHTLCLTIQGATDAQHRHVYVPGIAIAAAVTAGILGALRLTGAGMNPLSSLGISVVTGNYKHHWIYWVGPFIGMFIAALEYNLIYRSFWPDDHQVVDEKELNEDTKVSKDMDGHIHDNAAFHHDDQTTVPQTRF